MALTFLSREIYFRPLIRGVFAAADLHPVEKKAAIAAMCSVTGAVIQFISMFVLGTLKWRFFSARQIIGFLVVNLAITLSEEDPSIYERGGKEEIYR